VVLLPGLIDEVSIEENHLGVPELVGTMVEFSTVMLSVPFMLLVSSAWSDSDVSNTTEGWQNPDRLLNSA